MGTAVAPVTALAVALNLVFLLMAIVAVQPIDASRSGAVPTDAVEVDTRGQSSPALVPKDEPTAAPDHAPCYVADLNGPCVTMPLEMLRDAYSVIQCESRHNPRAISATGDYGLFQINRYWQEARVNRMGYEWEQMLEVGPNVAVATAIWQEQGFSPWSCRP